MAQICWLRKWRLGWNYTSTTGTSGFTSNTLLIWIFWWRIWRRLHSKKGKRHVSHQRLHSFYVFFNVSLLCENLTFHKDTFKVAKTVPLVTDKKVVLLTLDSLAGNLFTPGTEPFWCLWIGILGHLVTETGFVINLIQCF